MVEVDNVAADPRLSPTARAPCRDVLINNAGIAGPRKGACEITGSDAAEVFETNVAGIVRVAQECVTLLWLGLPVIH